MTADPQRMNRPVLVQTANGLPSVDSGWTTQRRLRFDAGSEGAGTFLGEAMLAQDYGLVEEAGSVVLEQTLFAPNTRDMVGSLDTLITQMARLLKKDTAGTVTIDGVTYTPFWWGQIISQLINPDGGDHGASGWQAAGIGSILDQIALTAGAVIAADGTTVMDPGYLPAFNRLGGADRSAGTKTVVAPNIQAYVHDLTTAGTGNRWTARQILDLLLALAANSVPDPSNVPQRKQNSWTWQISDPTNCMVYEPEEMDLGGKTLLFAINALINDRRGLSWRITVAANVVTINVTSTVATAITVGTYTLPVAVTTLAIDFTNDPFLSNPVIQIDASSIYDIIEVRGAHPWTGITVVWQNSGGGNVNSLGKGWNAAEEADWVLAVDATVDAGVGSIENVWRRYLIDKNWNGTQYLSGGIGLGNSLQISSSDAAYGDGGYNGNRSFGGALPAPPPSALRAERTLPCRQRPIDTVNGSLRTDRVGPRQPPVVMVYDGLGWFDLSNQVSVQIDDEPPSILIDDGKQGTILSGILQDNAGAMIVGAMLAVSVGFREAAPLKVSWQSNAGLWRGGLPRVKMIEVPDCELWTVLDQTLYGVDMNGVVQFQSGLLTVRDDTSKLRGYLALARAVWSIPVVTTNWTSRSTLDITAGRAPGVLVMTATSGDMQASVQSTIRRRSWRRRIENGCDMYDTTYDTERSAAQLEAYL